MQMKNNVFRIMTNLRALWVVTGIFVLCSCQSLTSKSSAGDDEADNLPEQSHLIMPESNQSVEEGRADIQRKNQKDVIQMLETAKRVALNVGTEDALSYYRELFQHTVDEVYVGPQLTELTTQLEHAPDSLSKASLIVLKQPADLAVFFRFDSVMEVDTTALQKTIAVNAAYLKANPSAKVMVAGFADLKGTAQYNLNLGEKRARTVEKLLIASGVSPKQITSVSFGENYTPTTSPANEGEMSKWRKVEICY